MLLTPHTFVGVAIGSTVPDPALAVSLSFIMHFIGDVVPHWDFYSNTTKEERVKGWRPIAVMADMACGIAIGLTATYYALWVLDKPTLALTIFLSGIASVLPDALEAPYIFMHKTGGPLGLLAKIQSALQFQAPLPWGVITQILVILVSLGMSLGSLGL
jgi:hypothetical protein